MAVDKNYCMSSYMAFRFIEREDMVFYPGIHHKNVKLASDSERILVHTSEEIGHEIEKQIKQLMG